MWLKERLRLSDGIRDGLKSSKRLPLVFTEHHESHAASAFYPSPYDEAAILTLDGVGEWSTTTCGYGRGNTIHLTHQLRFPHSLGLLYSAFTYYCGFRVNSGEYKLMGLAPYGRPIFREQIYRNLLDAKADGSFWLDMRYFNYCQGLTMTNDRFHRLFGGPPRDPEAVIEQRHMDLAASIQAVTEELVLNMGRELFRRTGLKNLVMAGGVALNCVANGRLLREGPFDSIWVQPAAGDAGGSLGAALFTWHQLLENARVPRAGDSQRGSLLGPASTPEEVLQLLESTGAEYRRPPNEQALLDEVSALLSSGKNRRLVPRRHGIRPAVARGAQHSRRSALARDAGDDEPPNQVPRELQAVCTVRARRACARVVRARAGPGKPVHADGGADRVLAPDGADAGRFSSRCAPRRIFASA